MRLMILAVLALSASQAAADQCDTVAARIAAQVGGSVRTRIGPAIKMQHPEAANFSVDCKGATISRVSGSKDNPGSVAGFAQLIARTSSLALGTTEDQAAGVMLSCVRAASRAAGTLKEARASGLKVECFVKGDYVALEVTRP